MKLSLFFLLTCSLSHVLCCDSFYHQKDFVDKKSKYEECLRDVSAEECDLKDCLQKYKDYSNIFESPFMKNIFGEIVIDPDAYTEIDGPEILIKTILRCFRLMYRDSSTIPDNFIMDSLDKMRLIDEWICTLRRLFKELDEFCNVLDKRHASSKISKPLREWIQVTRQMVERTDSSVRKLFIFHFDVNLNIMANVTEVK
jgi:hypothetical protein